MTAKDTERMVGWGVASFFFIVLLLALITAPVWVSCIYDRAYKRGYTQALDDARLGKPARYKLVQTAEKWVEVAK